MTATSFKDQGWSQRFGGMGDEAESRFQTYCEDVLKVNWERYGLDRPDVAMNRIPARIRYTPDYLLSRGFVEVQGLGRDQTFKLKLDKWGCLHWWNDVMPVQVYVWDSHKKRECLIDLLDLDAILSDMKGTLDSFAEGKAYFAIPADVIFEVAGA